MNSLKFPHQVSTFQSRAELLMIMNRAGSCLIQKKEQRANESTCLLFFFFTMSIHFGGYTSWKATCVIGRFTVGALGDHQRLLPSSLLPQGRVCVLFLCSPRAVCVCVCVLCIYVCVCVFSHTPPVARGQVRLGLVPDSGKSGQLQRLTQIPWCETHV